jgi:hypothetical protein
VNVQASNKAVGRTRCSQFRPTAIILTSLIVALASWAPALRAAPESMAIMGDSLNLLTPVYDTSWVVQLQNSGAITAHDLAVDGATTGSVEFGQLPTAVTLAQQDQIADAVTIVGANDVVGDSSIFFGGSATALFSSIVGGLENVVSSLSTANPGVDQVLANIPDITVTAAVQQFAAEEGVTAAEMQAVRNDIIAANAQIDQFAFARGIPIIDLFTASDVLIPMYPWTFGGHTFSTIFAGNGFDIQTQPEGLISNMVATAFDLRYGQNLPIFSDQQIVTTSGFVPNSATTFYDVRPFVILPEPSSIALAALGGFAVLAIVCLARFKPPSGRDGRAGSSGAGTRHLKQIQCTCSARPVPSSSGLARCR